MPTSSSNNNDSQGSATPNSYTGDVLAALQAEQANSVALFQLQQGQVNTLVAIEALQEFANDQLKKQTDLLTSIYNLLLNSKNSKTTGSNNPVGTNTQQVLDNLRPEMNLLNEQINQFQDTRTRLDKFIEQQREEFSKIVQEGSAGFDYVDSMQIGLSSSLDALTEYLDTHGIDESSFQELQDNLAKQINQDFELHLSNRDLDILSGLNFDEATMKFDLGGMLPDQFEALQASLASVDDAMRSGIQNTTGEAVTPIYGLEDEAESRMKGIKQVDQISNVLSGITETPGSGSGLISSTGEVLGSMAGDAVGSLAGDGLSAALTPVLGPLAPVVGQIGGDIIGEMLEKTIGEAFEALGELWESLEGSNRKTRDQIIQAGFEKIRQDVKAMGTYQIEVYQDSVSKIYSAWDKNLAQIDATQGYTKEQLNTLQDSVTQKLDELGYSQAINAGDYLDELSRTLNANLGGELAEVFATQSLILQKAVPEFDASSMASQFAAIWTNAEKEGNSGEAAMVEAMRQVAGATKAIEKTTDGNNQFIKSIPNYLEQAQTIVARAGGSVDQVASLTTQMMAAEGPLSALAPQLQGFTGELVTILTNQNDATAVALRSIMHDINADIGISATDFMKSFMDDTQGTLETAYRAIDQFIEKNENPGAEQEFLTAMESIFGISGDKLAQLDFGYIADQLAQTNANLNTSALLDAEALVKDGETATLEEQLVNNTTNMLLAQNAVRDTLDNSLMRKLEQNELNMEKLVWESAATQSVDLAEDTMSFFTKIKDIIVDLLDPFGLFKAANSAISAEVSAAENAANYALVSNLSSIGSDVASDIAGSVKTMTNTVGGATAAIAASEAGDGNIVAIQAAMEVASTAGSMQEMMAQHAMATLDNQQKAASTALQAQNEAAIGNYENTVENQQKKAEREAQDAEQKRLQEQAAQENAARAQEEAKREEENHDNLGNIAQSSEQIHTDVQDFTNAYIDGNGTIADKMDELKGDGVDSIVTAIKENQTDVSKLDDIHEGIERLVTLWSTYLEFLDTSLRESGDEGLRMSYSDRAQIMGRGLII